MTTETCVLIDVVRRTLVLTINRPSRHNAINLAVSQAIGDALNEADNDDSVDVVVLTGKGDTTFCAGDDLVSLSRGEPIWDESGPRHPWGLGGYVRHPCSKPRIAAVNGLALGGGAELVLASDLAVAAENAEFSMPEVSLGLHAASGGVIRLPRAVPPKVATQLLLTGERITAHRAAEVGLVNEVVPQGEALPTALRLADRISAQAPLAVRATSRLIRMVTESGPDGEDDLWAASDRYGRALTQSEDATEGLVAFLEKRRANWAGR